MLFMEALKELENRKYLTRAAWKEEKRFVLVLPGMLHIMQLQGEENPKINLWPAKIEDYNADDWEIV